MMNIFELKSTLLIVVFSLFYSVSCRTLALEKENIAFELCGKSKEKTCLYYLQSGNKNISVETSEGDWYSKRNIQIIKSKKSGREYVVVNMEFEEADNIPSNKVIILASQPDALILELVIPSWDPAYFRDVNGDGSVDIQISANPFNIHDARWPKWPVVLNGENIYSELPISEVHLLLESYLKKTNEALEQQKSECKSHYKKNESCFEEADITALSNQAKALESILNKSDKNSSVKSVMDKSLIK